MIQPLELSEEFNEVLDILENTKRNVFLTGRAGTGKSTLLQLFRRTTKKKTIVVAPTGVAALNVKGQTIHSFFGFPPRPDFEDHISKRKFRKLYQKMEVLIIDEISMVRADILDGIDKFLQINRDSFEPFGGVQMVLIGDLFQLPPIVSNPVEIKKFQLYYESPYFFSSKVMKAGYDISYIELSKIYRQDNRHFIRLLEAIRLSRIDYYDLEDLNERHDPEFAGGDFYITLTARNASADAVNKKELEALDTRGFSFHATVGGTFDPRQYPTEVGLRLKLGAQVMFIKNDPQKRFVNGTIGKISRIDDYEVHVEIEKEGGGTTEILVEEMEWEILKYRMKSEKEGTISSEIVGTFSQLPLKLAWAVTIHKSQGKTFNKVIIDMGKGAFEHGQTYVALSRCRTLDGIVLKKPITPRDVRVDMRVVDFYQQYLS